MKTGYLGDDERRLDVCKTGHSPQSVHLFSAQLSMVNLVPPLRADFIPEARVRLIARHYDACCVDAARVPKLRTHRVDVPPPNGHGYKARVSHVSLTPLTKVAVPRVNCDVLHDRKVVSGRERLVRVWGGVWTYRWDRRVGWEAECRTKRVLSDVLHAFREPCMFHNVVPCWTIVFLIFEDLQTQKGLARAIYAGSRALPHPRQHSKGSHSKGPVRPGVVVNPVASMATACYVQQPSFHPQSQAARASRRAHGRYDPWPPSPESSCMKCLASRFAYKQRG